jgi:hypothetical protein
MLGHPKLAPGDHVRVCGSRAQALAASGNTDKSCRVFDVVEAKPSRKMKFSRRRRVRQYLLKVRPMHFSFCQQRRDGS